MIDPEVLTDMMAEEFPGKLVLARTGAVALNDTLLAKRGGDDVKIPRWDLLGEAEVLSEGSDQTAESMATNSDTAAVEAYGKLVDITDWAAIQGYGDPVREAARQLAGLAARKVDASLVWQADGTDLIETYVGELNDADGTAAIAEAQELWEDSQEDIAALVVHSRVYADLRKNLDFKQASIYGGQPVLASGQIGDIYGMPVFVSNRTGTNRTSLAADIDDAVTTVPVSTTAGFPATGEILIGTEEISYTGRTAWTFTGCTRGANGSSAASHSQDDDVAENDAGSAAAQTYNCLLLKKNALCFFYQRRPLIETERDISKRATQMAVTVFGAAHLWQSTPKGAIVLEVNSTIT